MNCPYCGNTLPDNALFCNGCRRQISKGTGSPMPPAPSPPQGQPPATYQQPMPPQQPQFQQPPQQQQHYAQPPAHPTNQAPFQQNHQQQPQSGVHTHINVQQAQVPPPPGYMPVAAPPEASGCSWAAFIPFGIFAFANGSAGWGVTGCLGSFLPIIGWVYLLYILIKGKEMAWRMRRFDNIEQYRRTMATWDGWGIFFFILSILGAIAYAVIFAIAESSYSGYY